MAKYSHTSFYEGESIMANDFERLKNEADIEDVVNYLGMDVHHKGSAYFVLCPIPAHNDKHPTNCYFKKGWNSLYCTVCAKSIKAIDLIMYESHCSYGEAADTLWELEGKPDWYKDNLWKKRNKNTPVEFRLTGEEAKIIGLKLPKNILTPFECSDIKRYPASNMPKGFEYDQREIDDFLISQRHRVTYKDFMNEKTFKRFVLLKISERLNEYASIQKMFNERGINTKLFVNEKQVMKDVVKRIKAST